MDVAVVRDNAREIERYLEILVPKFEPTGGVPDLPMSRKERGSSRTPISDYIMDLCLRNTHASNINKIIRMAQKEDGHVEIKGRKMWQIIDDCLYDHTAIRNWKDQGGLEERRFYHTTLLLAFMASDEFDTPNQPYQITVYTELEDHPQRAATRYAQKINTFYTRRRMVEQLEEVEATTGLRGKEAMKYLEAKKKEKGIDWSVRKLRRAREVVNRAKAQGDKRVLEVA